LTLEIDGFGMRIYLQKYEKEDLISNFKRGYSLKSQNEIFL
jgi:hypothetical protein